jgi:hypothetical protein
MANSRVFDFVLTLILSFATLTSLNLRNSQLS